MDPSLAEQFAAQLALAIPSMLVYLCAAILAVVFWLRCPTASVLVLLAVVVLGAGAIVFPLVHFQFFERHRAGAMDTETLSSTLSMLGFAAAIVRTVGLGLLVAAVFVGRGQRAVAASG